jgi:hypothetical protein
MSQSPEPFAPPEDADKTEGDGISGAIVVAAWGVAGAAFGTAAGSWLHLFGLVSSTMIIGLGCAFSCAIAGGIAFRAERARSKARPQLIDARGRLVRPLSDWLFTIPTAVGALGFLALALIAVLRTGTFAPAGLLLVVIVASALMMRPLLGAGRLRRAVEAIEAGELKEARTRLEAIDRSPIWTAKVRSMAALNLGLLSLTEGSLDEAAAWYDRAGAESGRGLAASGLALVRTLQDRYPEAQALLASAASTPDGRAAQAEIDGVRLLLAFRRDGAGEARELGARLQGPGNGGLFLSVLALARYKTGDETGARELVETPAVDETIRGGIGEVVPELKELLWF